MRADFDFDDERDGSPWDRVRAVLRIVAEVALFAGAVAILYLAFRGPSGRPSASRQPVSTAPAGPQSAYTSGARPAAVAPAARPTVRPTVPPATSPASPGAGAGGAADPLSAAAQRYLAGRRGTVEAAIYDVSTGRRWTLGPQAPQAAAGIVNLEILEAVLNQRTAQRTVLSLAEQNLSPPMIEQSDAAAATTLWGDAGGAEGMRAFGHKAGLVHTSPSSPALTSTTPLDQVTLLRQLVQPSAVLDKNDQKYALFLLEHVASSQRWGVSGGVPAGVTAAVESGGLPTHSGGSDWQVNSVGWVTGGGRNYLMSVLSTGSPSEEYGIDTLNHLGALVWSALAPRH